MWARTVSKKKREAGKEYQNGQNKVMPARRVKHVDCSCSFKCTKKFTEEQRQAIFDKFWLLNDDEKGSFYSKFTERKETERKRTEKEVSRRQFSMLYYLEFDSVKTRVCKSFFLATLDISATRIQYFHSNLVDKSTGVPLERSKGKHPKKCVSTDDVQLVKDHINSFPRVESHYCRQRTKREYLCANLNVALMYDLYVQSCEEKGNTPVKIHKYRQIFQTEFNISFLMPKSDRCDKCEEYANRKKESQVFTEEGSAEIEKHVFLKNDCYEERKRDREGVSAVLCFDMENVIQLPRANVSNFYYKRKLSFFNLTVHSSVDKTVYCCVWPESLGGRGGNEIASGLLKVLSRFVEDHPDVTEIILWSDSCVPQNRNAMMATALKSFLVSHPNVTKITQKFSESGHSQIQEVDNAHSCIEKALNKSEVFSPVSLVRVLMAVRKKPQLRVLQMCKKDFLSFDKICKKLFFSKVPFTRVKQIMLESRLQEFVSFKFEHGTPEFSCVNVTLSSIHHMKRKGKAQEKKEHFVSIAEVPLLSSKNTLCKEKVNDLKSMLKYMPAIDVQYYEPILK